MTWAPSARARRAVSSPMPALPPIRTTVCPRSCGWPGSAAVTSVMTARLRGLAARLDCRLRAAQRLLAQAEGKADADRGQRHERQEDRIEGGVQRAGDARPQRRRDVGAALDQTVRVDARGRGAAEVR